MDNSDHAYAGLLNMMREQGAKDNPPGLYVGTMKDATTVEIDDLVLDKDDLLFADHLMKGYKYPLETPYVHNTSFGMAGSSTSRSSNAVRASGLKKGDLVAVFKSGDDDGKYVVMERLVSV